MQVIEEQRREASTDGRYEGGADPDVGSGADLSSSVASRSASGASGGRGSASGDESGTKGQGKDRRDRFDVKKTWQAGVGAVLIPLGVVVILFGWYGAAHTPYVQQQIPFMASGSFIGLGMMVTGGLLFWAQWLYRIYDQADLHQEENLAIQQHLVRALAELREAVARLGSAASPDSVSSASFEAEEQVGGEEVRVGMPALPNMMPGELPAAIAARGSGLGAPRRRLYATAVGSAYHLSDCPVVTSFSGAIREVAEAERSRMQPCRICRPDA
jgi:hypothetical protein